MQQTNKPSETVCFRLFTGASYAAFNSLHRVVKIGVMSLSCSLLTLKTQPVLAQSMTSDSSSQESAAIEIDGVVVTAPNLMPLNLGVEVVALIEKKDIEQTGVQNLQDLLRYVQGIDLRSRNGENVQADISIRGGTFDQTVILLNGVNFSDPQTGHYSLNLPVNFSDIERIEVLQGISAWQYGASPFTAAINIVTNANAPTNVKASLSGGMYGYLQGELSANYRYKHWDFGLSGGHSRSEGYITNTDFGITQTYVQAAYKDPKNIGNFYFQAGYQQKDYGANGFYSLRYREQYESTKVFLGSLAYSKQIQKFKINADLYYRQHHDRFALFRHEAPEWYTGHNYHKTDVGGGLLSLSYAWSAGETRVGADLRYEHIFSNNLGIDLGENISGPFYPDAFFTKAAERLHSDFFLQHHWSSKNKAWKVNAGVKAAKEQNHRLHWYAGANASYQVIPEIQIDALVQHTYRLPTFTDLYYYSVTQRGNPNLKPEEALMTEIASVFNKNKWSGRAGIFYKYGFEIIDWVRQSGEEQWHSENLSKLQIFGGEISINYHPGIFIELLSLDYTYNKVVQQSDQYLSLYATDYLRNQLKFSLHHRIWKSLGAAWQLNFNDRAGTYLDFASETEMSYKPYVLCDLKIYWKRPEYEIFAMANNLFNVKYFDLGNLEQAGIWVKLGVRFTFSNFSN